MPLGNFTQYIPDTYYANLTGSGLEPNPVVVVGFNGDALTQYAITIMIILQVVQAMCLLYLVIKSRRRSNPGRDT